MSQIKPFYIRVKKRNFSGYKDYLIHAYHEEDARVIAFCMDDPHWGNTIELRHREIIALWTEVISTEAAELKKLKSEHAALRQQIDVMESHSDRLLKSQRQYGNLMSVHVFQCSCGRCTVKEIYPNSTVLSIEVESLLYVRDIYRIVFGELIEFDHHTNIDRHPDANFIILRTPIFCKEHQQ